MDTAKLDKWADLLLDTGKRNNLVNFKDTKSGSVEIIAPDFLTVFQKAERASAMEVFDPQIENDDSDPDDASESKYTKQFYLSSFQRKLKKNQILLYSVSGKPIQTLKKIGRQARSAIEETGVNIAYLALGFVHWTESDNSQYEMCAPLLLAPVSIENKSAVDPFVVRVLDDDIIVNPTFQYKLQNDYGIKLPEYDEDDGIKTYIKTVSALVAKLKWTVDTACKIGIFSFLKINMYKDLKENAAKIIKNANVRALLGMGGAETAGNNVDEKNVDLLDLHNVVDADSSQAEAIQAAKEGQSFVLQGPPGTGKSQTITNIIAECLYDGKKVLFVSEKLAALNVVYDKLKKVGLEEFCLELHSHKANKKLIIEELCRTLRLAKSGVSPKAERELSAKKEAQRQLDAYAAELHKVRPVINATLYGLYEELSACRSAGDVDFVVDAIETKGEDYLEQAENCLARYAEYTNYVGYDYRRNAWYGYVNTDCSFNAAMRLTDDLKSVAELCDALGAIGGEIANNYGITPATIRDAQTLREFFALAGASEFITSVLLEPSALDAVISAAKKLRLVARDVLQNKAKLDAEYDGDVYSLDGQTLYKKLTKQYRGWFARLFGKEYRQIINDLRLCRKNGKKPKYSAAVYATELLKNIRLGEREFGDKQPVLQTTLADGYDGIHTDFDKLLTELNAARQMLGQFGGIAVLSGFTRNQYGELKRNFRQLAARYSQLFNAHSGALGNILASFSAKEYDVCGALTDALKNKFTECVNSADKLENWCDFVQLLRRAETLSLRGYIDLTIALDLPVSHIVQSYKKTFYKQWINRILYQSPILTQLARVPHDELIARFKQKDALNFEINKAKIKAKLSAERPNLDMIAQGSAISVLLRENEKKRKQKGIRQLLHDVGDLALTLKPCFLMSPLSVSTYLDSDMQFDVVVFDEASQIFPQDAVGAIYRGKQLIVVGDSKQMPPSNFFGSTPDSDQDDETEDVTDYESILDLCSATFAQRRLKWHYRSRYEQLIAFSNKNFYDNDLVTFPSAKAEKTGYGVDFIYVDGVFDRKSKTNRAEAERIADLVFEHIVQYPNRSLGVVAFSIAQQNLIERIVDRRRRQNAEFEEFFATDRAEPFFVKNLETVQGDERDTIIFSVAYAKDSLGKLLFNFGPLNRSGGERRLNVAATRAKLNVKLVSSIHYYDIDLTRTKSEGARLLREYLDYAENGSVALERSVNVNPFERFDSEFEMEVCEFLRGKGYSVDTQVGCSSFRIDMALKRPDSSDYLLAIECDGASYHSSKTARDRDRLRQDILERMGWKFYRIWSTDWFRNKRTEQERLLSAVKKALDSAPAPTTSPAPTPAPADLADETVAANSFEQAAEVVRFEFAKYKTANARSVALQCNNDILSTVVAIVRAEAPISEEWLLKRIVFMFGGREKVTTAVRQQFDVVMHGCGKYGLLRKDGFIYVRGRAIPMLRVPDGAEEPREIKYIDLGELALGLKELLKLNISAEKQGLFKLITQYLGFNRMGEAITERLESALELIADETETNGDMLSLKQ